MLKVGVGDNMKIRHDMKGIVSEYTKGVLDTYITYYSVFNVLYRIIMYLKGSALFSKALLLL